MSSENLPAVTGRMDGDAALPAVIEAAGGAARFVWEEFFSGQLRNPHTRRAYTHAVRQFLTWAEGQGVALHQITPGLVGRYVDQLHLGIPSKKQHLAALRAFFDALVLRHVVLLNPVASVRGDRYSVVEGKTPEIAVEQARKLLASIAIARPVKTAGEESGAQPLVVGLRDRAIVAILIYTAARCQ
jgi:integrase/recombinase XerD